MWLVDQDGRIVHAETGNFIKIWGDCIVLHAYSQDDGNTERYLFCGKNQLEAEMEMANLRTRMKNHNLIPYDFRDFPYDNTEKIVNREE